MCRFGCCCCELAVIDPSDNRSWKNFKDKKLLYKGFSEVYKAIDPKLKRVVAIKKVQLGGRLSNKEDVSNEEKQIIFFADKDIPYLVEFYDFFKEDTFLYIVMGYYEDGTLRSIIEKNKRPDDQSLKSWARDLSLALAYLKINQIIHNDIKPENILMYNKKNTIRLADVGLAQVVRKYETVKDISGTKEYQPPEVTKSSHEADIWAYGIVFYELLYFEKPESIKANIQKGQYIHRDKTDIGIYFKQIFENLLLLKPEERWKASQVFFYLSGDLNEDQMQTAEKYNLEKKLERISDPILDSPKSLIKMEVQINLLHKAFDSHNTVLLTGVAGSGKTVLANRFAYNFSKKGSGVVLINANSKRSIDDKFSNIIKNMGSNYQPVDARNMKNKIEQVFKYIDDNRKDFLFVFDDIYEDEMEYINEFYEAQPPSNLKTLLISRNRNITDKYKMKLDIKTMPTINETHAKEYLLNQLNSKLSNDVIETIYNEIIKENTENTPESLANVVCWLNLLIYEKKLITTNDFDMLIKNMRSIKNSKVCQDLFEHLDFVDTNQIAKYVLNLIMGTEESTETVIELLLRIYLITMVEIGKNNFFRINSFALRAIMKMPQKNSEKKLMLKKRVVSIFLNKLKDIENVNKDNAMIAAYLKNHIVQLLEDRQEIDEDFLRLCEKQIIIEGKYYFNYGVAIEKNQKLIKEKEIFYIGRPNHPSLASSIYSLAENYRQAGQFAEAIKQQQNALEIRQKTYKNEPNHPEISACLNSLGLLYNSIGEYKLAKKAHEDALKMRRNFYKNQNSMEIAQSLNNLALANDSLKAYDETSKLHEDSLMMRRTICENQKNHPQIAQSLNNIGVLQSNRAHFAQALESHNKALEMFKSNLDNETQHPLIAISLNNLANAHFYLKNYAVAIKIHQEALQMQKTIYAKSNPNHPAIATSMNNLALAYEKQGDFEQAVLMYESALDKWKTTYKGYPNHPNLAACEKNIQRANRLLNKSVN